MFCVGREYHKKDMNPYQDVSVSFLCIERYKMTVSTNLDCLLNYSI